MMSRHDLLRHDYFKNHEGRSYAIDYVLDIFDKYVSIGGKVFDGENVLIIHEDENDICEFHCFNGGSGKDLTTSINNFLDSISDIYTKAVTYYDNPRINQLVEYSKYPAFVDKIDEGEDRTYRMSFELRGH